MNYWRRREEVSDRLENGEVLVLSPGPEMYYLTGFDEQPFEAVFLIVPSGDNPVFIASSMYEKQLSEFDLELEIFGSRRELETVISDMIEDELEAERLLFNDGMHSRFVRKFMDNVEEVEWGLSSEAISDMRAVKNEEEIEAVRSASAVADEVVREIRSLDSEAVGMTEKELVQRIEKELFERGKRELPFEVIVGSGPNGAKPHHRSSDREIAKGDPVVLDFGCFGEKKYYPSDQTRTLIFAGEPSEKFRDAYQTVKKAQKKALDVVEPGVSAADIDRAARDVIREEGYEDRFITSTGHGVGLEIHEKPSISEENDTEIKEGMIFSIEPGIYIENEFGVRIEDLVLVTEEGVERLNKTSREF